MDHKVLVVDDCNTICKILESMLKNNEVDTTNSSMEALLTLEDHKIAFVDYNLIGRNGASLTRTMKIVRKIYVIGMSDYDYKGNVFDDFIRKPLTVDKIQKAMHKANIAIKLGRY